MSNSDKHTKNTNDHPSKEKPWLWKPGQSGNPAGRPPGKTMKEYARDYLKGMNEAERLNFMKKLKPVDIWQMAEGKPKQDLGLEGKDGAAISIQISKEVAER